ncbi:sugar kinase [Plantactinospora soyae]|uniref:2-dehydro-3-deoxygluconokinase n=1 Tax=Plantactinospora soyae TaxID=1544732 RepID=A0A927R7W2_9ACTN|nr:sugar kinase [Plantactinospora soyae]MBE1489869.1 2-dehydro-3-deoxygluconokinase [Plantactinospora soyae]
MTSVATAAGRSSTPLDAICVGETMVMVTPTPGGRLDAASTFVLRAGGAESNVAMFLAALGHRAAWASRVGADPLGDLVVEQVAATGVDTSLVEIHPARPTGVYLKDPGPAGTKVYYYRRESAAASMDPAYAARISAVPSAVLHLSGITAALSGSCRQLVDQLLLAGPDGRRLISFDVNYRLALWDGRAGTDLLRLAQAADVVFVGLDEAAQLWDVRTPQDVRKLIDLPGTLVVKNGSVDAVAFHGDGVTVEPARRVDVVEPVGAGDAFAAGWLSAALRGLDQTARLKLGHLVAGAALGSVGDFAALPPVDTICAVLGIEPDFWYSPSEAA